MANRNLWIGTGVIVIVIVIAAGIYVYLNQSMSPGLTPTEYVTLYEGDQVVSGGVQGVIGFNQSSMTSPGPTLNFTVGDVVSVTVYNVGTTPHNWAIVNVLSDTSELNDTAQVMFNAQVASGSDPILPGLSETDVFQVTQAGTFFYVCQVPGDVDSGMWGNVVVST